MAEVWTRLRDAWPGVSEGPGHPGETLALLGLHPTAPPWPT